MKTSNRKNGLTNNKNNHKPTHSHNKKIKLAIRMAKLGKSSVLGGLAILVLASVAYAGVQEACKGTPDPAFCATLLQPSAAEFEDNNPTKMENAGIKAAIKKVEELKTFMEGPVAKGAKNKEVKEAISQCKEYAFTGTLNAALDRLKKNNTGNGSPREMKIAKAMPKKMVENTAHELRWCADSMKRVEPDAKAAGRDDVKVTTEGGKLAHEASLACFIAESIIKLPS